MLTNAHCKKEIKIVVIDNQSLNDIKKKLTYFISK